MGGVVQALQSPVVSELVVAAIIGFFSAMLGVWVAVKLTANNIEWIRSHLTAVQADMTALRTEQTEECRRLHERIDEHVIDFHTRRGRSG